jgi:hypothetical protein
MRPLWHEFPTLNLLGVALRGLLKKWGSAQQQRNGWDYGPQESAPPQTTGIMEDEVVVLH